MRSERLGKGGGFYFEKCDNIFITKSSISLVNARDGGAIYLTESRNVFLQHNLLMNNMANKGAGLYIDKSKVYLWKNKFIKNASVYENTEEQEGNGGGIYF